MFAGYNYFLVVVTAVVCVLAVLVAVYILIAFQHPEDRNQAWFPKAVVVLGISLAIWTVLLFPLDVPTGRPAARACRSPTARLQSPPSSCGMRASSPTQCSSTASSRSPCFTTRPTATRALVVACCCPAWGLAKPHS